MYSPDINQTQTNPLNLPRSNVPIIPRFNVPIIPRSNVPIIPIIPRSNVPIIPTTNVPISPRTKVNVPILTRMHAVTAIPISPKTKVNIPILTRMDPVTAIPISPISVNRNIRIMHKDIIPEVTIHMGLNDQNLKKDDKKVYVREKFINSEPKLSKTKFNFDKYVDIDIIYMKSLSSVYELTNKTTGEQLILKVISTTQTDKEFNFAELIYESEVNFSPNFIKIYERGEINTNKLHDTVSINSISKYKNAQDKQNSYIKLFDLFKKVLKDNIKLTKEQFRNKIIEIDSDPYILTIIDDIYNSENMKDSIIQINNELKPWNMKFKNYIQVHDNFDNEYKSYEKRAKYIIMEKVESINIGYFLSPKYINQINLHKIVQIIFVLLYIIYVFESYGIIHGDLYNRNLFLKFVPNYDYIEYNIEGTQYYIDMEDMNNYIIKVGDYGLTELSTPNHYDCFKNNPFQTSQFIGQLLSEYEKTTDYKNISSENKTILTQILKRLKECAPLHIPEFISEYRSLFNILQIEKCLIQPLPTSSPFSSSLQQCKNINRAI